MSGSAKQDGKKAKSQAAGTPRARVMNRLKDEVYREMLLLEGKRPGSEMGLALALLRAVVVSKSIGDESDFGEWLKAVCPLGLGMIELSLEGNSQCDLKST